MVGIAGAADRVVLAYTSYEVTVQHITTSTSIAAAAHCIAVQLALCFDQQSRYSAGAAAAVVQDLVLDPMWSESIGKSL
jgi:hypothetical protein